MGILWPDIEVSEEVGLKWQACFRELLEWADTIPEQFRDFGTNSEPTRLSEGCVVTNASYKKAEPGTMAMVRDYRPEPGRAYVYWPEVNLPVGSKGGVEVCLRLCQILDKHRLWYEVVDGGKYLKGRTWVQNLAIFYTEELTKAKASVPSKVARKVLILVPG